MSSMTSELSIDKELASRLENDERFRRRFIRLFAQTEVAEEIRRLRKLRRLRQADVAKLASTGQSAISRIEKADYDGWSFKTLIAIAEELKARLRIHFEPIEDVANEYRGGSYGADVSPLVGSGTGEESQASLDQHTEPAGSVRLINQDEVPHALSGVGTDA